MGCLSTLPVLVSVPADMSIDFAFIRPVAHPAAVEKSLPERVKETDLSSSPPELYLIHHRFLI